MREETAAKKAAEKSAVTVAPPIRIDSMNPEDGDEDDQTEPNRPVSLKGAQMGEDKPKKMSLFRRITRAICRL